MIETTYVRLEQAAVMLDTDADTLLIAAYEGRLRLHGLLNQFLKAEKREWDEDWEGNKFSYPIEEKQMWFWMVPIDRHGAGYLMQAGYAVVSALSEKDDEGRYWTTVDSLAIDPAHDRIPLAHVFLKRAEVESIKAAHSTPAPDTIKDAPLPDRSYASNWLMLLNQASRRWWANASKDDPTTQPDKTDVVAWLTERGMTESLAKHAATIIRPEWAHTGRKPEV